MAKILKNETLILLGQENGITLIPSQTSLTRLNYFDGKFLRADDLKKEQDYLRQLVQFSNKAGGSGVVHGFNLQQLSDDRLKLSAGLAIDLEGRVLFMPDESKPIEIGKLISQSQRLVKDTTSGTQSTGFEECEIETAESTTTPVVGVTLYIVGISHAEALCGQEDVFGKMCEEACVTATDRPYRLEGVVLRALPLSLNTPLVTSSAILLEQLHLRSRVASAYFQDESTGLAHLISKNGLASSIWCNGALPSLGALVPLAIMARSGDSTLFLDQWIARRERMDAPAKHYWQWRMHMRPWNVYIAQILQFQCQLREIWTSKTVNDPDDPCTPLKKLVVEAAGTMAQLENFYQDASERVLKRLGEASPNTLEIASTETESTLANVKTQLKALSQKFEKAKETITLFPVNRVLIDRGIIELPSAGYLPVVPGSNLTVNQQIQNMLGEGVDLRFCVVRPDYVAHALEEAQHMERISLLKGLDDPNNKEAVDILVPNGEILTQPSRIGKGWKVALRAQNIDARKYVDGVMLKRGFEIAASPEAVNVEVPQQSVIGGAARSSVSPGGAAEFFFAGIAEINSQGEFVRKVLGRAETNRTLAGMAKRLMVLIRQRDRQAATEAQTSSPDAEASSKGTRITMRSQMLRAVAVDYQRRSLASVEPIESFPGLATDNTVNHIALWIGALCAQNPFTVNEGTSINASLDLRLLLPRSQTVFLDVALNGQLIIDHRLSNSSRIDRVEASFTGNAFLNVDIGNNAENQAVRLQSVPVRLVRALSFGGGGIGVEVDLREVTIKYLEGLAVIQVITRWLNEPELAEVLVELKSTEGFGVGFGARLERDDAVLQVGNPVRNMSETAIAVLATREGTPNFAADAAAHLFGRPPVDDGILKVLAREDWVLFHRRRDKKCGIDQPQTIVATRRYQIYHLLATDEDQFKLAYEAVKGADAEKIFNAGFNQVAMVEFEGGQSSITTPVADLMADWQAAQPGDALIFGAIGSQGAAQADGEAVTKSRLLNLEMTLMQSSSKSMVENIVLPKLPELGLAGFDGAIFLITETEKKETFCHDIYLVAPETAKFLLEKVFTTGQLSPGIQEKKLKPWMKVEFQQDGTTLTNDSKEKLTNTWANSNQLQFGYGFFDDSTEPSLEVITRQQSSAIVTALGVDAPSLQVIGSPDIQEISGCKGVTILAVTASNPMNILLIASVWDDYHQGFLEERLASEELINFQPKNQMGFEINLRKILEVKPVAITVAVSEADRLNNATQIIDMILTQVEQIASHETWIGITQSQPAVIKPEEVKELETIGIQYTNYDAIIFFSRNRYD